MPLSTRRTRTRSPGKRNAKGKCAAWLRPCMKIFAMPVSVMTSTGFRSPLYRAVDCYRQPAGRSAGIDARCQPETLAIKQHVRRKRPLPPEIVSMRPSPGSERVIVFAFVEAKGVVDLAKAPLRQLDRLDYGPRDARSVEHHHPLADLGLGTLARRPARRPLWSSSTRVILSTPRGADDTCRPLATAKFRSISGNHEKKSID